MLLGLKNKNFKDKYIQIYLNKSFNCLLVSYSPPLTNPVNII